MTEVIVRAPSSAEEIAAYFDLRWRVLRAPWHQPRGSERDEWDDDALHYVAVTAQGEIVGTARLKLLGNSLAQVGFLAVEEAHRNHGIGSLLLRSVERAALSAGVSRLRVNARVWVTGFYRRRGYETVRKGKLLFGEIPHFIMEKDI